MNRYGFTAIVIVLLFLIGPAFGQEPLDQEPTAVKTPVKTTATNAISSIDITSVITILIFSVTILLIVLLSARSYSNASRALLEQAFEKNKELPEELQESVSVIIKTFPQAEPLGLPRGSLRAIVMLIFSFAFVYLLFFPPKQISEMITALEMMLAILVGFYFGSRYAESRTIKFEPWKEARIYEAPEKEALTKEDIIPTEALPEEKKRRKKREELI